MATKRKKRDVEGAATTGNNTQGPQPGGRAHTLSVAVPSTSIAGVPGLETAAFIAGQVARAAVAFGVDEVVVYDPTAPSGREKDTMSGEAAFMVQVLQFLETPPYLRSTLIARRTELQHAAAQPPLRAPHHLTPSDWLPYREGAVLRSEEGAGSYVDVGLDRMCHLPECLPAATRVTVHLGQQPQAQFMAAFSETMLLGKAVHPSTPRTHLGLTWGYSVRVAQGLQRVLKDCPFHKGGYDLAIGLSAGGVATNPGTLVLPRHRHALLVWDNSPLGHSFDALLQADPNPEWSERMPQDLFNLYLSPCPGHPADGLRAEDAVLAGLAFLQPAWASLGQASKTPHYLV